MRSKTLTTARLLRWSSLPETRCTALVWVSNSSEAERAFGDAMSRGRVRVEWTRSERKSGEYLLNARAPERIRLALSAINSKTKPRLLELGLRSKNTSYQADAIALALWPERIVKAMGARYELERSRRRSSSHGERYAHWTALEFYDRFYSGAMLLPSRMVKSLRSLRK